VTCGEFLSWLDEGMTRDASPAPAHARDCDACAGALAAARAVDAALARQAAPPALFAAGVMARVRADSTVRLHTRPEAAHESVGARARPATTVNAVASPAASSNMGLRTGRGSWWSVSRELAAQLAGDPVTMILAVTLAMCAWRWTLVANFVQSESAHLGASMLRLLTRAPWHVRSEVLPPSFVRALSQPEIVVGVALGFLPLIAVCAGLLFLWGQQLSSRPGIPIDGTQVA
jgi:hypothetical protein